MLPANVHSYDLLRPQYPDEARPQTNEPVSVHVLDGEETVLFGTGFESGFETLAEHLDAFGGPDVVVIEHGDPDHFLALPAILDRYDDVTVAMPKRETEVLEEWIGVEVDVPLEHDEVRWGVRTIHVPGHTPGNMSFLDEESGTLFVGDTFVHKNSFAAAPGEWTGSFAPVKPGLNADDEAARSNMAILADYDFEAALVTHGLNVPEGAKAEVETLIDDLGL